MRLVPSFFVLSFSHVEMKADSLYLVHVHQCTAHSGNSQRIFVIAVLFLSSPVRKMLLPSEEKATGGVSPDEQLLFWRRVLGQMKVIAVQRDLQLNEPGDLAAILRLGFLLRFSFLRQKSKKSDSHVRILSCQSLCPGGLNTGPILSIWQILGT